MVRLLIPYLAIYNNEHLSNTMKMAKVDSNFAKYERNPQKLLIILIAYQSGKNFAKSGHTVHNPKTFLSDIKFKWAG